MLSHFAAKDRDLSSNDYGFSVVSGKAVLGETYPILATITAFHREELPGVEVQLNGQIRAKLKINNPEQVQALKRRAFEPAIFVSRVTSLEPSLEVECKTVIFGKQSSHNA
jgi:hypothetical protein